MSADPWDKPPEDHPIIDTSEEGLTPGKRYIYNHNARPMWGWYDVDPQQVYIGGTDAENDSRRNPV